MDRPALTPSPAPRPPEPDLGRLAGSKLGNYRLERVVGRGRMGVVYLATDEALLRPTAVKVLSWSVAEARGQDPVRWFLAEARLVARINHPRVVQIYGVARQGDFCYLAMEYVAGASAEATVERDGPFSAERATDVLLQAASALDAAHRAGVVHRDVKPANLLVGAGGVTKLGDFGMALGSAEPTASAQVRVGTPYYTAPEVWRGERASVASDVYALGATYFQLLTGRPPYPGHDVGAVEQAHLRAPIPDPRELARGLPASAAALVTRALAKAPRDRQASAEVLLGEAQQVLQEVLARAGPRAAMPPPAPAPPRAPSRRPLPTAEGRLAAFGFARRPFCTVDPAELPRPSGPLTALRAHLVERLLDGTPVLAVTGADGSGRGALARLVAASLAGEPLVLAAGLAREAGAAESPLPSLCRGAGLAGEGSLEALLGRLGDEARRRGRPAVVVLDGATGRDAAAGWLAGLAGLAGLARTARGSRRLTLVLAGEPGLAAGLARAGLEGDPVPELAVPRLDRAEVGAHVRGWLDATLAPHAPPVLVSPDALGLLALRSEGALERLDALAENMLVLAAAESRRTLTSWHAWAAADGERWADAPGPLALPGRPHPWPPAEVIDVIDACRRGAGLAPWPRASGEPS